MNRNDAKKIAQTITNEQINEMFNKAKENIKDWTKVSSVNKGLTKGSAWNILAKDFDISVNHHILAKTNYVREFGEFLPDELKPKKKSKRISQTPIHQEPVFPESQWISEIQNLLPPQVEMNEDIKDVFDECIEEILWSRSKKK